MYPVLRTVIISSLLCLNSAQIYAAPKPKKNIVPIDYILDIKPDKKRVDVEIVISNTRYLKHIDFNLEGSLCRRFKSEDTLVQQDNRLTWQPESKQASLSYQCKVNHKRPSKYKKTAYDALITKDWSIFRGDDMIPSAKVRFKNKGETQAQLIIKSPKGWSGANTGWERNLSPPEPTDEENKGEKEVAYFLVDNPERRFDRPTGWMIAGKLGTRRVKYEEPTISRIAISAPANSSFKRMDALTFLQFVWPEVTKVCGHSPEKLLVVGAGDPMWRGGLSAGNSFYMHADLPLISENGTSTLLHELFHMCTGIRGKPNADWIAEGLAEFYSVEILHRSGGLNADRHQRSLSALRKKAEEATTLELPSSKGATTAKAVLVFDELNRELKEVSNNQYSLDDIVYELAEIKKVDKFDLENAFKKFAGQPSNSLKIFFAQPSGS